MLLIGEGRENFLKDNLTHPKKNIWGIPIGDDSLFAFCILPFFTVYITYVNMTPKKNKNFTNMKCPEFLENYIRTKSSFNCINLYYVSVQY